MDLQTVYLILRKVCHHFMARACSDEVILRAIIVPRGAERMTFDCGCLKPEPRGRQRDS